MDFMIDAFFSFNLEYFIIESAIYCFLLDSWFCLRCERLSFAFASWVLTARWGFCWYTSSGCSNKVYRWCKYALLVGWLDFYTFVHVSNSLGWLQQILVQGTSPTVGSFVGTFLLAVEFLLWFHLIPLNSLLLFLACMVACIGYLLSSLLSFDV